MALSGIFPVDLTGVRFEETSTTALFAPGTVAFDNQGGMWVYGKASGALTIYDLVTISAAATPLFVKADTDTAAILTTPAQLGIAQVAFADTEFGWVWRGPGGGVGHGIKVNCATDVALNAILNPTATAGVVDDAATDEAAISGLRLTATTAAGGAIEVCSAIPISLVIKDVD